MDVLHSIPKEVEVVNNILCGHDIHTFFKTDLPCGFPPAKVLRKSLAGDKYNSFHLAGHCNQYKFAFYGKEVERSVSIMRALQRRSVNCTINRRDHFLS